ncbi:hypothetical protein [Pseudoalteromonas spongiae]|uniref:DUF4145 domain-containing protein n=1 Tax=Pseudoalteromonas spongiae TaxID=298657 RepID=A0ABU8EUI8_9GAMM
MESKDLVAFLSPALVILGWWVVFLNTNRTAKRSEVRNLCDKCVESLAKLDDTLHKEFSKKATEGDISSVYDLESAVVSVLALLEIRTRLLEKKTGVSFISEQSIYELKRKSGNQDNVDEIRDDILDIIEELEEKYNDHYTLSRWRFSEMYMLHTFLWVALVLSIYFVLVKFMCRF